MANEYEIDCSGTEDEVIDQEGRKARARYRDRGAFAGSSGASQIACWVDAVAPLVRIILAFVVAMRARSVREALARARRLLAPVNAEGDVERGAKEASAAYYATLREDPSGYTDGWENAVRPFMVDRARLARELQGCEATASDLAEQLIAARADLEACGGELQTCRATLAEERADVDRLTAEVERWRAEAAELAASCGDLRAKLDLERQWQKEPIARLTAAPGDALERAWPAFVQACGYTQPIERLSMGWVIELAKAKKALRAALAAVEPRGVDEGETAPDSGRTSDPCPEQPEGFPSPGAGFCRWLAAARSAPPAEVTDAELADVLACTSDHGPLAWPGGILRRLVRAEQARRAAPASADVARLRAILAAAPVHLDAQQTAAAREIVARLDVPAEPRAMTLERLASGHVQALNDGTWEWSPDGGFDQGVVWLGTELSILLTQVFNMGRESASAPSPAARGVLELLEACMAEPPAEGLAMVQRAFRINGRMTKAIAMLRAMSAAPTPPRVLTEAESEARDRLAKTLAKVSQWHAERAGYGGAGQDWHARCETACADAAAFLAASRGDVQVATCPGCWTGGEEPHARSEGCSGARPEAPEMAVTTGEAAPRIAPREVRYQAVMKHDARIKAGLGRDETDPAPPRPPPVELPCIHCGYLFAAHEPAGQYDICPVGGRQFDDRPARKVGGGQ